MTMLGWKRTLRHASEGGRESTRLCHGKGRVADRRSVHLGSPISLTRSFSTPSTSLSAFIPITAGEKQRSSLTTHKHVPLNCSDAATGVHTINGLSKSNAKPFPAQRQRGLHEFVFCALAESEAFWKVTPSANIVACEICPKKELIICLLSQNSTFLHYAEVQRKTDSCSSGIAARAQRLSTRAEPPAVERRELSGPVSVEGRPVRRALGGPY